ncbi:hypothetical protein [Namhaeicola litoreus]|uniref:DUF3240 domain-containing protein n=1 Tax=Namhaeicola litoreus TaxID=1052145 RepID=A0ABW3Y3A8_9FLAO
MVKLIALTAVKEFEKKTVELFRKASIPVWSVFNIDGFKNNPEDSLESKWFSGASQNVRSIMVFSFVEEEKIDHLINELEKFNQNIESSNPIRLAVLSVEKFI